MWKFYSLLLLSLCVPLSYVLTPRVFPGIAISDLWGGIQQPTTRSLYVASMLLAAIGFLAIIAFAYVQLTDPLFWSMVVLLVASTLWMPLMYLSLQHPSRRVWTGLMILVLAIIGCGAIGMVAAIACSRKHDALGTAALAGASYLCFHVVVLDFIVFTTAYLQST